ncbi:LamG domain-containing protein [Actinoplanes hulinensis]|uniref:LamG domain-containing protein n=1 Tax=Actinoplanes hulinensis TaxID=1144547 RepID=A0ABS7B937_9ACTN|nr:LamG-like jellyroll fold domain-containing protein [Actinoplanes hulinensis]MBW6437563.1 LamG domain-containing protein [Actinoplanes hulinensis]
MRSCLSAVTLVLATLVVTAVPAHANEPLLIAHYSFNARAGALADESGNGHTLRMLSFQGGRVRTVAHGLGAAVAFPGKCIRLVCPHVVLQSGTSADLNPGTRDIAFGADVLLPPGQTSPGQNIVQKGYSTTSSQYKLQIDGAAGHPSCVLVDVRQPGIRIARSVVTTADGRWHRVRCQRSGTSLTIYVDNVVRGRTTVPAGLTVFNDQPLRIGSKGAYRDNDQFNGVLDNVWVRITR